MCCDLDESANPFYLPITLCPPAALRIVSIDLLNPCAARFHRMQSTRGRNPTADTRFWLRAPERDELLLNIENLAGSKGEDYWTLVQYGRSGFS